jgi:hypothetical protein
MKLNCGATRGASARAARATSLFDLPEADKCLLAYGEFKVGSALGGFDVQSVFDVHLSNQLRNA